MRDALSMSGDGFVQFGDGPLIPATDIKVKVKPGSTRRADGEREAGPVDIIEFLTARLRDDEEYALEAAKEFGPDWIEIWSGQIDLSANLPERQPPENRCWDAHVQTNDSRVSCHMVRHDPARVLAEVKAKRRIIERHTSGVIRTYQCGNRDHIQDWQCERAAEPYEETRYCEICDSRDGCVELQELAAVHDSHPDYNPAWRVDS